MSETVITYSCGSKVVERIYPLEYVVILQSVDSIHLHDVCVKKMFLFFEIYLSNLGQFVFMTCSVDLT